MTGQHELAFVEFKAIINNFVALRRIINKNNFTARIKTLIKL